MLNVKIVTIAMEPIIVVIPLLFEEKKRVSPRIFLNFVALLRFFLEDRFLKVEVERGNM